MRSNVLVDSNGTPLQPSQALLVHFDDTLTSFTIRCHWWLEGSLVGLIPAGKHKFVQGDIGDGAIVGFVAGQLVIVLKITNDLLAA